MTIDKAKSFTNYRIVENVLNDSIAREGFSYAFAKSNNMKHSTFISNLLLSVVGKNKLHNKIKKLLEKHLKQGEYSQALNLLDDNLHLITARGFNEILKVFKGHRSRLLLLSKSFMIKQNEDSVSPTNKVLYFLYNSYPYTEGGYAIRSHEIAKALSEKNVNIEIVTRAGYPLDVKKSCNYDSVSESDLIEDIVYNRIFWPKRKQSFHKHSSLNTEMYLLATVRSYIEYLKIERPKLVIAASNYITALPLYLAAQKLGIPFFYDLRGFWELTEKSRNKDYEGSEKYKIDNYIESELIRNSDKVFSISQALKNYLISNNIVDKNKIYLLPNGSKISNDNSIISTQSDSVLKIGFIGTLNDYEGLDDLLVAMKILIDGENKNISLSIVGDDGAKSSAGKSILESLKQQIIEYGIVSNVEFFSRVKHKAIKDVYHNLDLIVIPRKNWEVSNLITPLKLLEAMGFGKAILASDVDAIAENIIDGETGYLYKKGDARALANKLKFILENKESLNLIGCNAQKWVSDHRTWEHSIVELYNHIPNVEVKVDRYSSLTSEKEIYQSIIDQNKFEKQEKSLTNLKSSEGLKVVLILHSSLPYMSGGYATRIHGLMQGIRNAGVSVYPYTRPGFPNDLKRKSLNEKFPIQDTINGINYHRIDSVINRLTYDERAFMWESIAEYIKIFQEEKPDIVHGRSTYLISLPSLVAAYICGIPFVYEVSGLWELVFESRDDAEENQSKIERIRALETIVMTNAHQLLTLTTDMRDEIISRGVSPDKITLVPNSVDINTFHKVAIDEQLKENLGLKETDFVFGYIGSMVDYEGLDDLVISFDAVASQMPNAKLVLVGSGNIKNKVLEVVKGLKHKASILILDRVPHDKVVDYYRLIDVVVFARKPWDVCEKVSPMKPFEAMACEKVILASSVKALQDIVQVGKTGYLFDKGSHQDLSEKLVYLYSNSSELPNIGLAARKWVAENRSWNKAGKTVLDVYNRVQ